MNLLAPLVDLQAALMLLTRLPAGPSLSQGPPDLARAVWAYPLIGGIVGCIGAGAYAVGQWLLLPTAVSAIVALSAMVLATGAFHEDGLADTADGIGGGFMRDRKLEIMRDSRIGTYGTVALVLSLALRGTAVALLADRGVAVFALIASGVTSRGVIVALLAVLPPARDDGVGVVARNPPRWALVLGIGLALVPAIVRWPLAVAAAVSTAVVFALGRRYLGGYTGDLLGSGQQVAECLCLLSLLAVSA